MKEFIIKRENIIIKVEAEKEHDSIDSTDYDPQVKAAFKKMHKEHPKWGWCSIAVTVTLKNATGHFTPSGTAYLGHCSYENKGDFILNSGYYKQMVKEAAEDMLRQVNEYFTYTTNIYKSLGFEIEPVTAVLAIDEE